MAYQSAPVSLSMGSVACLASLGFAIVQADNNVAARSVIGPRIDWASSRRETGYCFCLIARTPRTSRAMGDLQDALREPAPRRAGGQPQRQLQARRLDGRGD